MHSLVVSLRGVNFGFWSRLGCSRHSANILSRQETQNYAAKRSRSQILFLTCFVFIFVCFSAVSFRGQNLLKPRLDWSPFGLHSKFPTSIPVCSIWEPPPPRLQLWQLWQLFLVSTRTVKRICNLISAEKATFHCEKCLACVHPIR